MNDQNNIFKIGEDIDLGDSKLPTDFDPFTETNPLAQAMETAEQGNVFSKPPRFEYAAASEDISDTSKTFEELRIEKASDFPELEDGKRVSWSVEYGKVTKPVADPKGTTIGKLKTQIETSKEFLESLKKLKPADRDKLVCKIKPRVTAQSKGEMPAYKGVFVSREEAEQSDKIIRLFPANDGKVYEQRKTEMGVFTTPSHGIAELSEVESGFVPALPPIPATVLSEIVAFFRSIMGKTQYEALIHILWDKDNHEYCVRVPKQTVSKISVQAVPDDYGETFIHVMDIHSHNNMAARFSSIDDADEKATRLYAVIGRLDCFYPQMRVRISNGGKYMPVNPNLMFEGLDTDFPEEWLENVKFGGDEF
ncbi:hypothetical protein FACS1894208_01690 [Clostridia bacterium]|nr:hypothetical protein FACS1894208_01690 [Clostridia bacterium]